MRDFHNPVFFDGQQLDRFQETRDPATISRVAHDTARLLIERAHSGDDASLVRRLTHYTDEHGLDTIAELWSAASERSLPGVLWRTYLLRSMIVHNPLDMAELYESGRSSVSTVDEVVAGVGDPAGPDQVCAASEEILHEIFAGDMGDALDRAAAFTHLVALGYLRRADVLDAFDVARASALTERARSLSQMSGAFASGASLWRRDALD